MSKNPFGYEDEGGFGSGASNMNPSNSNYNGYNTKVSANNGSYNVQSQIADSKSRTISSQHRALASIAHSEQIGISAAEELNMQGEKLKNVERKVTDIGQLQNESQRQINSLSSVFGGLKNMFSRRQSTPVSSNRGIDVAGDNSVKSLSSCKEEPITGSTNTTNTFGSISNKQQQSLNTDVPARGTEVERNLALMSDGMSRLKNLALGLESELQDQNARLDSLAPKLDKVTDTTTQQTKQLNKLLGNKK